MIANGRQIGLYLSSTRLLFLDLPLVLINLLSGLLKMLLVLNANHLSCAQSCRLVPSVYLYASEAVCFEMWKLSIDDFQLSFLKNVNEGKHSLQQKGN